MYAFTVELCTAENDPYDRTLSVMVKSEAQVELVRCCRISPQKRLGQVLLEIDRLALAWASPQLPVEKSEHLHDTWDRVERALSDPFPS